MNATQEKRKSAKTIFNEQVTLLNDRLPDGDTLPSPITIPAWVEFEHVYNRASNDKRN